MKLNKLQHTRLTAISKFLKKTKWKPSFIEIAKELKIGNTILSIFLSDLEKKGFIKKDNGTIIILHKDFQ